jgi:hypothetical protein
VKDEKTRIARGLRKEVFVDDTCESIESEICALDKRMWEFTGPDINVQPLFECGSSV